ncbi:hypothetical protein DY000_02043472 [Brassica cretica]|uniref:Mannosyltransferase n=1 Tax=Brassica cretica TaxID=69181 RepID=A0ABQ7BQQ7_BRACR|nr:hypothetical protein DY000_02043472 [Brassica cretica]
MRCFSSSPKNTHHLLLFFIAFFTLRFLSLVVFEVVFLVVGLPLILPSRLGFQDKVLAFIAACVSVALSFAMFVTPSLDIVLLRLCSVDLENCFWSQVWAHVFRGLVPFFLTHVVLFFPCFLWYKCAVDVRSFQGS